MSSTQSTNVCHLLMSCGHCFLSNNTKLKRCSSDRNIISVVCLNTHCSRRWSFCGVCPKATRFLKSAQIKRHIQNTTHQQHSRATSSPRIQDTHRNYHYRITKKYHFPLTMVMSIKKWMSQLYHSSIFPIPILLL